ncbi:class I SAM-dependent methyltransferase [Sutterella sp.]|uniref:class I SAM-dependent methyltransferase n=1 Tax=Sutterella sp. TaxID=1981025 RepID=UPI0026DF3F05|nr:class I SAM-dependent methyltransferase [Sutterella sp.]MDO5530906.1 class I SAM-dependent methyltransferase [Sutterella sp.]
MTDAAQENATRNPNATALLQQVSDYWDTRAEGYSIRTIDELQGPRGEAWSRKLFPALALPEGARVADIGCGPGLFALLAAKAGYKATGCDASPGMLARAKANAEAAGLECDFIEADATKLPFEDASLDAVISRYLVWNLPDPKAAFREWLRVLKPGGAILYADGNHYRYLTDADYARVHAEEATPYGHAGKFVLGVDTSPMERLARSLPLTGTDRPGWDIETLLELGCTDACVLEPELARTRDPRTGTEKAVITNFMVLAHKAA